MDLLDITLLQNPSSKKEKKKKRKMKNIPTFDEFVNESYTGPESVTFSKCLWYPWDSSTYFTLDGKIEIFSRSFMGRSNNYKVTDFLTKWKFPTTINGDDIILDGFFDVTLMDNPKLVRITQTSKKHTLELSIPISIMQQGKVNYHNDRPN